MNLPLQVYLNYQISSQLPKAYHASPGLQQEYRKVSLFCSFPGSLCQWLSSTADLLCHPILLCFSLPSLCLTFLFPSDLCRKLLFHRHFRKSSGSAKVVQNSFSDRISSYF